MKIFLSCVSTEFKSYRLKLANHLGALEGHPYEIKVQEDFQQGGHTLLERLAEYVLNCDLVIHLVGEASGARPTPEHEQSLHKTLGETDFESFSGWSYTQWEYHLARRFKKKVLVYFAKPEAPRDCGWPIRQSDDDARLQQAYIQYICNSGEHRKEFAGQLQLVREVFHDFGLEPNLKVNNLPYKTLGSLFKGRKDFLEKIRTTLSQAEHRGHQRVAAITTSATAATVHGLGGIGKTRAAIEFAHRHTDDYTALLFVRADSPEGLKANLGALCRPFVLNLVEKDAKELDVQVAAVLHWLQQHPGWLLIFDNVDTEQAAQAVEGLLGQLSSAGQVLITSRISRWPGAVESLALDVLTEADAASFLLERTANRRRKQADDPAQAHKLAVTLGQLALALEQAGAMIETNRMSFAQYHEQWQTQHDRVLTWFNERLMRYPLSVAITWQTSFDQLAEPARRLLHQLAWFSPDPIPETLLDVTIEFPTLDGSGKREIAELQTNLYDALADLEAYSLVTRVDDVPTFFVHRLVQDVTRRSLQGDEEHHDLTAALHWINEAFVGEPQDVRSWPTLDPLASHAQTCVQFADKAQITEPTTRLLSQLGLLFLSKAQHAQAEPLMRRALAVDEQIYGENHPRVATELNNLAGLFQSTNRLKEAEPLMRRALAIDEQSYGENHPNVAINLSNLAQLLQATDRLKEAEPLMQRALAINEESYGENHPDVAIDLNNLAGLLQETNRLKEAEPLMRRALAINEESYGENHPEVAIRLNNLARLLQATNRQKEAEPLMLRALAIDEKCYGENHPNVATGLNNLALLLQETNRQKEAESLMRRALAIDEQCYGENHPRVASELNNLALLLQESNRQKEAEPLIRRALVIDEQSYGENHPRVACHLNNLAQLLQEINRQKEAEPLMRRALAINEQSYGESHPNVAICLNNLAQLLEATNRQKDAESLMLRALAIDEQCYGENHPRVATDLNNLAQLLVATNRQKDAEPLMRRALAIDEQSYGENHPKVAIRLNNLALLLKETNRQKEAESLMLRALAIDEQSYGESHPRVAGHLNNLALLLQETNRYMQAESLMRRALAIDEQSYGENHPKVAIRLNNLALLFQETNRQEEAEPLMLRNVGILLDFSHRNGYPHAYQHTCLNNFLQLLLQMGLTQEQADAKIRELGREYGIQFGEE